jgi:hypothetical protein
MIENRYEIITRAWRKRYAVDLDCQGHFTGGNHQAPDLRAARFAIFYS